MEGFVATVCLGTIYFAASCMDWKWQLDFVVGASLWLLVVNDYQASCHWQMIAIVFSRPCIGSCAAMGLVIGLVEKALRFLYSTGGFLAAGRILVGAEGSHRSLYSSQSA